MIFNTIKAVLDNFIQKKRIKTLFKGVDATIHQVYFGPNMQVNVRGNPKVEIGDNVNFRRNCNIMLRGDAYLKIGDRCFFNNGCSISVLKNVVIGENVMFGEAVKIYDHDHQYRNENQLIRNQGYTYEDISIGNNVWIGSNVIILKGIKVGNNVVIGAGVIVKDDIPDNVLVHVKQNLEVRRIYGQD